MSQPRKQKELRVEFSNDLFFSLEFRQTMRFLLVALAASASHASTELSFGSLKLTLLTPVIFRVTVSPNEDGSLAEKPPPHAVPVQDWPEVAYTTTEAAEITTVMVENGGSIIVNTTSLKLSFVNSDGVVVLEESDRKLVKPVPLQPTFKNANIQCKRVHAKHTIPHPRPPCAANSRRRWSIRTPPRPPPSSHSRPLQPPRMRPSLEEGASSKAGSGRKQHRFTLFNGIQKHWSLFLSRPLAMVCFGTTRESLGSTRSTSLAKIWRLEEAVEWGLRTPHEALRLTRVVIIFSRCTARRSFTETQF